MGKVKIHQVDEVQMATLLQWYPFTDPGGKKLDMGGRSWFIQLNGQD